MEVDALTSDSLIRTVENSHGVVQRRVIHVGVPGGHRDCLVPGSFLNEFQTDTGLSQPGTECVPEIVPAKVTNLRFFESRLPPFLVVPYAEDNVVWGGIRTIDGSIFAFKREPSQFLKGVHHVGNHRHGATRLVFGVAQKDDLLLEVNVPPAEPILLALSHSGTERNVQLVDAVEEPLPSPLILGTTGVDRTL